MKKAPVVLMATFGLVVYPVHAFAAKTFAEVVDTGFVPFFDRFVIPLLYAVLFLLFMFGMVRYFFVGGEENRQKGKVFVVWAIVGMVAVFSVWGIVNLLLSVLAV
jgi:Type IV secretion system pilin